MDLQNLQDKQLLTLIRTGNKRAFEVIYDRYWKELFVVAAKKLKNDSDAEGVVQEVFINLYVKKSELNVQNDLKPYLHTVLKYKTIDVLRKRILAGKYIAAQIQEQPQYIPDAQSVVEKKELTQRLVCFANTLPKKCRQVFLLKLKEFSNKEIAMRLKISEKTVEGHFAKAKKMMISFFHSAFLLMILIRFL